MPDEYSTIERTFGQSGGKIHIVDDKADILCGIQMPFGYEYNSEPSVTVKSEYCARCLKSFLKKERKNFLRNPV